MVTSEAPLQEAASCLTGKNSIGALLRCRHTAIYPRPPDHGHVQCVEVGRERRKGRVQRRLSSAWGLGRNVPGPAGSREDEAPSGAEGTERFRGPVRWSPDPGGLGGVPHPRHGAPSARAENAAGRWQRRARWPAEGAPAPPGKWGAPPYHLREGTSPAGGGAGVRGGSDSQPALSSQEASHYPASLKSN